MTDQQSTPLNAEALRELAVAYRPDRDAAANVMRLADLRREVIAYLDAARERPCALDVERTAAATFVRALLSSPVWPADEDIPVPRAILARLTEPDAGEGTER